MGNQRCTKCLGLTAEFVTKKGGRLNHWASFTGLHKAAKTCSICAAIFRKLYVYFQSKEEHGVDLPSSVMYEAIAKNWDKDTPVLVKTYPEQNMLCAEVPVLDTLKIWLKFSWISKPISSPKERVELARQWVAESLKKASMLNNSTKEWSDPLPEATLPSRLLEINWNPYLHSPFSSAIKVAEYIPFTRDPKIRLISPKPGSQGSYIALSHRSGRSRKITLTKETLKSFEDEIPFNKLPKSFQDAVMLTRELKCGYLWIDTLCIIQNSHKDWIEQSSNMWQVYRNATCTISTHCSYDDTESFLDWKYREDTKENEVTDTIELVMPYSSFRHQINGSDLSKRAWVFQERILSSRLLHFGNAGLFFEDAFGVKSEDHTTNNPELHSPWSDCRVVIDDFMQLTAEWYRIIEKFKSCSLSFESDRLIAITGLVRSLQARRPEAKYYSGIWLDSLHEGLLWASRDSILEKISYDFFSPPPSWSWAHWKGAIQYPCLLASFKSLIMKADILDDNISDHKAEGYRKIIDMIFPRRLLQIRSTLKSMKTLQCTATEDFHRVPGRLLNSSSGLRASSRILPQEHMASHTTLRGIFESSPNINQDSLERVRYLGWISLDNNASAQADLLNLSCIRISSYSNNWWEDFDDGSSELVIVNAHYVLIVEIVQYPNRYKRVGMGVFTAVDWFDDSVETTIHIE